VFRILKHQDTFSWSQEFQAVFREIKASLACPPVLAKLVPGDTLIIYLAVTAEAISAILIREVGKSKLSIYFVSRALQGAKVNYQRLEKVAYALLITSKKLHPYFNAIQS
jgi:hypothetical protein